MAPEDSAPAASLSYSIRNILSPDFGLRALQHARRSSCSSNRISTPASTLLYRPYASTVTSSPPQSPTSPSISSTISPPTSPDNNSVASTPNKTPELWPAWVYCTRYSDRPSSG